MEAIKFILVILGIVFAIYLFSIGLPKCKAEGFKFSFKDLFKQTALSTASGGYLIVLAFIALLSSALLYFVL